MKIAFATTQSLSGSTVIGRVLPLAEEMAKRDEVHVVAHKGATHIQYSKFQLHFSGSDPFLRTPSGKIRQSGFRLIFTMLTNAISSAITLIRLKPDVIIIVKSLPESVLATRLARLFIQPKKIILDVDDFELTALVLTSIMQRATIHWAERVGAKMADNIVTATPFLSDHFEQLTKEKKPVTMMPTGVTVQRREHPGGGGDSPGVKEPRLIYAGSLSLSSGHRIDLLPEILAQVRQHYPEIQLHIYGTGDDEEKIKHDGIVLHGRFMLEGLVKNISSNTILIDPIDSGIANRAKSSFRVMLAAALGLPVVTSDIGIRPYLLPAELHQRCFAKPADATDYAAKIVAFLQSPLTHTEQENLLRQAEPFNWVHLAKKYAKIITAA